jgi:hypothetical protein
MLFYKQLDYYFSNHELIGLKVFGLSSENKTINLKNNILLDTYIENNIPLEKM